ncbi:MAG TPA: alpha/beta hydrolase [Candidatus Acidoferrum sp.]|nr:alpha/beta hydrolase [Candidatus Acidoferrum sp.]
MSEVEPQLVFIHGAGGTHRVWRYQRSEFPGSTALDLPGHPKGTGCNTIPEYAEFVTKTIVERELRSVVLVGHSMGGAITIEIALTPPPFLKGIVLVGSGARLRVTSIIKDEVPRDYAHAAEVIAQWAYSPKTDAKLRKASIQELLEVPAEVTYGDFQACDSFDRMNKIGRIHLPALIVCGEDDALTPVKYSQYMKERIRNARIAVIPGAGHSVMLEKPEELNNVLRSFLAEIRLAHA